MYGVLELLTAVCVVDKTRRTAKPIHCTLAPRRTGATKGVREAHAFLIATPGSTSLKKRAREIWTGLGLHHGALLDAPSRPQY